jgi:hypothetical protein
VTGEGAGTNLPAVDWAVRPYRQQETIMPDDATTPPYIYEGVEPVPEAKSTISEISETIGDVKDAVKDTAHRIGDAIESGKKPGMPLSVLANVAREAPLGSLLVAFLLGVAVARRR